MSVHTRYRCVFSSIFYLKLVELVDADPRIWRASQQYFKKQKTFLTLQVTIKWQIHEKRYLDLRKNPILWEVQAPRLILGDLRAPQQESESILSLSVSSVLLKVTDRDSQGPCFLKLCYYWLFTFFREHHWPHASEQVDNSLRVMSKQF
jgi:hypothetical protein